MSCGNVGKYLPGVKRDWAKNIAKFICLRAERMMMQILEIA